MTKHPPRLRSTTGSYRLWFTLSLAATAVLAIACGGTATDESPDPTQPPPTIAPATAAPAEVSSSNTMPDPMGYGTPDYADFDTNNGFISGIFDGAGDSSGFAGDTFNAAPFDTQQLQGQPVVINFWFPSCPPCRAELPEFESAYQEYGPPGGGNIAFVGVQQLGLDSIQDGFDLFDELGITFPGLPDNGSYIQFAYEIFSFPTTVFLDSEHNEFRRWQGALNHENLVEILDELQAASSADPPDEPEAEEAAKVVTEPVATEPERVFEPAQVFDGFGDATGFAGESFHHGTFDTRELEGTPMVINFWFPSCPPCRAEMPNLEDAHKRTADAGVDVVFVGVQGMAVDTAAQGIAFLDTLGVTYTAVPDMTGDIHWAYEVSAAPTTYFLDSDHNIAAVHYGYIRWDDLEEKLALILPESVSW